MINIEHSPVCSFSQIKLEQYLPPAVDLNPRRVKYRAVCNTCHAAKEITFDEVRRSWPELKLCPEDQHD